MEAATAVQFKDLLFDQVQNMQIIDALNANIGVDWADGVLYKNQKKIANEARNRNLLLNPGPQGPTMFNWYTSEMKPKDPGWEQVKGIQRRVLLSMGEVT